MATQVGLVTGATTGKVWAVINPDDDMELDNPRFLLIQIAEAAREPLVMVKVALIDYMAFEQPSDLEQAAKSSLGIE